MIEPSVDFDFLAPAQRPDLVFDLFDGHDGFFTGSAFGAGLLNRPEGKRLPCFKAGISVINKYKPTVATGTDGRFVLIFRQSDPNDYAVLVKLVALIPTESSLFGNRNVTARRGFSAATMLFLFTPESPDCLVLLESVRF